MFYCYTQVFTLYCKFVDQHCSPLAKRPAASTRFEGGVAMPRGAPTTITMHAVTGAFADARVESAATCQLFRAAFPVHLLLLAIVLALFTWKAFVDSTFSLGYFVTYQLSTGLALMGRVLVHMMRDTVRGQRVGSWLWIALIAAGCSSDMMQGQDCNPFAWYVMPLASLSFSLINGSHGLGFAAKFSLISLWLVDAYAAMIACDEGSEANKSAMGVTVLGSVCAHLAELQLRRNYAEKVQEKHRFAQLEERNEQLQAEKERMMYDMQLRAHSLDEDGRSAICRGLHAGPTSESGRTDPELAEAAIAAEVEKQSKRSSSQPLHPEINVHAPSESLLASLPPGAPSSPTSASTASSTAEADRQHYAEIAAQGAAQLMTEQKAPRPKWVETGRQFAKSVATKRGRRAALIVPTRLEPGASPGVERVELAELAELAKETDEEVMHHLVVRHILPAAEADQKKAGAMAVAQQSVTSHISPRAALPCSSISLQQYLPAVPVFGAPQNMFHPRPLRSCHAPEPPQPVPQPRLFPVCKEPLQDMFATLVMRDYTPRRPSELPTSRWVSCN